MVAGDVEPDVCRGYARGGVVEPGARQAGDSAEWGCELRPLPSSGSSRSNENTVTGVPASGRSVFQNQILDAGLYRTSRGSENFDLTEESDTRTTGAQTAFTSAAELSDDLYCARKHFRMMTSNAASSPNVLNWRQNATRRSSWTPIQRRGSRESGTKGEEGEEHAYPKRSKGGDSGAQEACPSPSRRESAGSWAGRRGRIHAPPTLGIPVEGVIGHGNVGPDNAFRVGKSHFLCNVAGPLHSRRQCRSRVALGQRMHEDITFVVPFGMQASFIPATEYPIGIARGQRGHGLVADEESLFGEIRHDRQSRLWRAASMFQTFTGELDGRLLLRVALLLLFPRQEQGGLNIWGLPSSTEGASVIQCCLNNRYRWNDPSLTNANFSAPIAVFEKHTRYLAVSPTQWDTVPRAYYESFQAGSTLDMRARLLEGSGVISDGSRKGGWVADRTQMGLRWGGEKP
ncbi:hypothetical protein C8F04DRAFT_1191102 [Mycena alexandri]|uniref:Uncharacterized protein n=1 Tax=Mycena alexandri TaxID=1745969 RepID=A0AAD6WV11_9AGAR|nr:hypothetical protein C8F04DRAFT_1191102 [Mycena alexandri]